MRTAVVFLVLLLSACAEGTYSSPVDGRLMSRIDKSFAARDALAQTYTAASDLLFYGDNTEFANQFRSGDIDILVNVNGYFGQMRI